MDRPMAGGISASESTENGASAPILPDFADRCIARIIPTLIGRDQENPQPSSFVAPEVLSCRQVVLLVVDGLGWNQLQANSDEMPHLMAMQGGRITSVLPTTTATALTSITTGHAPFEHGVVGYRIAQQDNVLNVLKWSTPIGDARKSIPPTDLQTLDPFLGTKAPVVSRAEFAGTGFTDAHLANSPLSGWRMPSAIAVEVEHLLHEDAPFIYAYYDGIDKIAHDKGLGEHYRAELRAADRIIGDICAALPAGACLCVTADHGQIEVLTPPIILDDQIMDCVAMMSGEGRFRWLHAKDGMAEKLHELCVERHSDAGWIRSREEVINEGWLGGKPRPEIAARLGDVALIARDAVAYFDPHDTGELRLIARHGSATAEEMYVPFLSFVR